MNNHPTELLPAFSLGCLDPEEYVQVRQHLETCSECQEELKKFEQTCAELVYAVPSVEPPASLKSRLMTEVRPKRSFPWFDQLLNRWPRLVPSVSLAALILVGLLGIGNLIQWQHTRSVDYAAIQLANLQGTDVMPQANGVLLVTKHAAKGVLIVSELQALDSSMQYQLWLIKDGQRSSGGVFSVSSSGEARLMVVSQAPIEAYDAFGITIEPFGGSPGPTGPKVLGGRMTL